MSQRIKRYAPLLRRLSKLSAKDRKKVLKKYLTKDVICCISECCKNVIKGNVPLNSNQKRTLLRYKNNLRKLALKKTSSKQKKRIIQSGGFLGALLSPIVSILGNLFGISKS